MGCRSCEHATTVVRVTHLAASGSPSGLLVLELPRFGRRMIARMMIVGTVRVHDDTRDTQSRHSASHTAAADGRYR